MIMRLGPYISEVGGASWRIHIKLKKMCNSPACSQPAVRTVHHRPNAKTGSAPLSPNKKSVRLLGESKLNSPLVPIPLGSEISISMYREMHAPITNCVNPRSRPSRFRKGPKPHNPGFRRPQVRHCWSLTPTRVPQEGQTTDPHFCRNMRSLWGQTFERSVDAF